MGEVQVVAVGDGDVVLAGEHALVALQQQGFGLSKLFFSGKSCAQHAFCPKALPIVGLNLLLRFQRLARYRLSLAKLPLRQARERQIGLGGHRFRIIRAQSVLTARQGLRGLGLGERVFALFLVHEPEIGKDQKGGRILGTQRPTRSFQSLSEEYLGLRIFALLPIDVT